MSAVFVDHEVSEERLIEEPALLGRCSQVGRVTVTGEVERCGQRGFDLVGFGCRGAESFLDGSKPA
ncbi:hypothetical protein [Streptomyces sp. B93]|uniref:hypothetical protein n=1 Tax=Streptomyces sp. B93 TaxID=2824875 RepID=UPI001B367236|nr:hypothetical protein [Streptomyces sp. B93]MBQ1089636.1 hypothetical protein [Streptomyces sp. B93]